MYLEKEYECGELFFHAPLDVDNKARLESAIRSLVVVKTTTFQMISLKFRTLS